MTLLRLTVAARTVFSAALCMMFIASSAFGQFAQAANSMLAARMRWVQFEIVSGRIVASSIHVGANMNSSTNSNGRIEKVNINLTGPAPDIHYELTDKAESVWLDVNGGNDFTIRTRKKVGGAEQSVEFVQPPGKDLTLTVEDASGKQTLTAPTIWHLLLDDPKLTQSVLAPTLELLKPGWQLATTAQAIEDALCKNARLLRTNDRARWETWVQQLSSVHYADRQAAEQQLLEAGREIVPFLRSLDRTSLDAEQWRRIRNVIEALDDSQSDSVEQTVALLAGDVRAWLPLLDRNDPSKQRLALEQLEQITGGPIDFDLKAPAEVRKQQLEKLREHFTPAPVTESEKKTEAE